MNSVAWMKLVLELAKIVASVFIAKEGGDLTSTKGLIASKLVSEEDQK